MSSGMVARMGKEVDRPAPDNRHLAAALDYLARGWSIVPVAARAKRPIVRWETFQHRLPGQDQLVAWFRRWPDANLAVVTGALSGLVVLDVDPRHGGEQSLAMIEERHGRLPATIESVTGGGGRHVYFAHPGHEGRNRVGLMPGLDLRGDGGVIVVPPSIHPSGNPYRWRPGHGPEETTVAALPRWLEAEQQSTGPVQGHTLAYWRKLLREGVAEGQRNSTIASLTGHLLWHGVDPDVVREMMLVWNRQRCTPPLGDDEVSEIVHNIQATHARRGDSEEHP
jgi:hypothetical protein